MSAKVQRLSPDAQRRIIAVSDIHGNLAYFRGLLEKVRFSRDDILIICGDFLEKGAESLNTLRYIMELSRGFEVHTLLGNCDSWHKLVDIRGYGDNPHIRAYVARGEPGRRKGLVAQMCDEIGFERRFDMDMEALSRELGANFAREFSFLRPLPHIIDTEKCTFVHGGLTKAPLTEQRAGRCMKNDFFMRQGLKFDKWIIAGHTPVVLYGGDIVCANPIIDEESRIISIDGGCVLKDDGQLNALVIEPGGAGFSCVAYDHFPVERVKTAQAASEKSAYFRWGDNVVRVLERGEEFSRCRHERSGYEMDILTKYLRGDGEICRCNDCTDYVLPLAVGDEISVVERTSRGLLAKHKGVSGWVLNSRENG